MILKSSNGYQCYSSKELMTLNRTVFLEGEVTSESAMEVARQITFLDSQNHDDIILIINSPGGSIIDGLIIYDVINAISSDVSTLGLGICASMGAFLLSSGTRGKRKLLMHSKVFIHDPLLQARNTVINVTQAIELGNNLKEVRDQMNEILAKNTSKTIEEINEATKKESFFTANEAVEFGLCDEVIKKI